MKYAIPTFIPSQIIQHISFIQKTREYRIATTIVLLQFVIGAIIIGWNWRYLPPLVPLWYSKPWGEDRLVSPFFLFLPIGMAVIIYGLNTTIVTRFANDHIVFARVLFLVSALVSILSIVIVIQIIRLIR